VLSHGDVRAKGAYYFLFFSRSVFVCEEEEHVVHGSEETIFLVGK
jgi:hypothetical protein